MILSRQYFPKSLAAVILLCCSLTAGAQQPFTEGVIRYAVSIGPVSGGNGFTEHAGTYTITVKGSQIRKDLVMNTGYQNTQLMNVNAGTLYSLQSNGGQKYAIQLTIQDLKERQRPYEQFSQKEAAGDMTIAGWPCKRTIISYKDGTSSELYYTTAWQSAEPTLFDRFPGIRNIPLAFEYRNEEGIVMHFQAEKLEVVPVESALFRVPADYKVISNAEYKKQNRQ
jgi:hypothetical protein